MRPRVRLSTSCTAHTVTRPSSLVTPALVYRQQAEPVTSGHMSTSHAHSRVGVHGPFRRGALDRGAIRCRRFQVQPAAACRAWFEGTDSAGACKHCNHGRTTRTLEPSTPHKALSSIRHTRQQQQLTCSWYRRHTQRTARRTQTAQWQCGRRWCWGVVHAPPQMQVQHSRDIGPSRHIALGAHIAGYSRIQRQSVVAEDGRDVHKAGVGWHGDERVVINQICGRQWIQGGQHLTMVTVMQASGEARHS